MQISVRTTYVALALTAAMVIATAMPARAGVARDDDLFVLFDASTCNQLPVAVGDAGAREAVKTGWSANPDHRAAGMKIEYSPSATFAALAVTADAYRDVFKSADFPAEPEMLVVSLRATRGSSIVIQVEDFDGDLFESTHRAQGDGWHDIKPRLGGEMKGWEKITRVDGKLNARVRSVSVGLRKRDEPTGRLELTRVAILPSALTIAFKTDVPGNLFVTGNRVAGTVKKEGTSRAAKVTFRIVDGFGKTVTDLPTATLGATASNIPLPDEFGYYSIIANAPGFRSSPVAAYGVIPDNRVQAKEPNSPFGVCCHWGDYWYKPMAGTVAKRIGIAWIRDGHHAEVTKPGGAYQNANRSGLCQMSITGWTPKNEKEVLTDEGEYVFKQFMDWAGAYAKSVGNEVRWYDMCNEPVFGWSKVFGSQGNPPRWLKIFCKWFIPQYYEVTQANDPDGRLLMECYPSQLDALIESGSAKYVGALSPHPYAHKAEPEDHGLLNGGYRKHVQLMAEHNLSLPIWIGEMGFTSFLGDSQHFKSVTELEQAGLLVRALSLHLGAGVEKIFYYDLVEWTLASWGGDPTNDPYNCEFHFGIIRKDFTAKPAAVAYANLIAQTKGCRWLGRNRMGNALIYAFKREGEPAGLIAWTRTGTKNIGLPAGAEVTDVFGTTKKWGGGQLQLTTTPVYIHGCSPASFAIAPVDTYAKMPKFYDETNVQLGVRYGKRGARRLTGRRSKAKAETPAQKKQTVSQTSAPSEDVVAFWDYMLAVRMAEAVNHGTTPRFFMPSTRRSATLMGIENETTLKLLVDGPGGNSVKMTMSTSRLTTADKANIACALVRDSVSPDHCIAGFFLMASGDRLRARDQLRRATQEDADAVREAFK